MGEHIRRQVRTRDRERLRARLPPHAVAGHRAARRGRGPGQGHRLVGGRGRCRVPRRARCLRQVRGGARHRHGRGRQPVGIADALAEAQHAVPAAAAGALRHDIQFHRGVVCRPGVGGRCRRLRPGPRRLRIGCRRLQRRLRTRGIFRGGRGIPRRHHAAGCHPVVVRRAAGQAAVVPDRVRVAGVGLHYGPVEGGRRHRPLDAVAHHRSPRRGCRPAQRHLTVRGRGYHQVLGGSRHHRRRGRHQQHPRQTVPAVTPVAALVVREAKGAVRGPPGIARPARRPAGRGTPDRTVQVGGLAGVGRPAPPGLADGHLPAVDAQMADFAVLPVLRVVAAVLAVAAVAALAHHECQEVADRHAGRMEGGAAAAAVLAVVATGPAAAAPAAAELRIEGVVTGGHGQRVRAVLVVPDQRRHRPRDRARRGRDARPPGRQRIQPVAVARGRGQPRVRMRQGIGGQGLPGQRPVPRDRLPPQPVAGHGAPRHGRRPGQGDRGVRDFGHGQVPRYSRDLRHPGHGPRDRHGRRRQPVGSGILGAEAQHPVPAVGTADPAGHVQPQRGVVDIPGVRRRRRRQRPGTRRQRIRDSRQQCRLRARAPGRGGRGRSQPGRGAARDPVAVDRVRRQSVVVPDPRRRARVRRHLRPDRRLHVGRALDAVARGGTNRGSLFPGQPQLAVGPGCHGQFRGPDRQSLRRCRGQQHPRPAVGPGAPGLFPKTGAPAAAAGRPVVARPGRTPVPRRTHGGSVGPVMGNALAPFAAGRRGHRDPVPAQGRGLPVPTVVGPAPVVAAAGAPRPHDQGPGVGTQRRGVEGAAAVAAVGPVGGLSLAAGAAAGPTAQLHMQGGVAGGHGQRVRAHSVLADQGRYRRRRGRRHGRGGGTGPGRGQGLQPVLVGGGLRQAAVRMGPVRGVQDRVQGYPGRRPRPPPQAIARDRAPARGCAPDQGGGVLGGRGRPQAPRHPRCRRHRRRGARDGHVRRRQPEGTVILGAEAQHPPPAGGTADLARHVQLQRRVVRGPGVGRRRGRLRPGTGRQGIRGRGPQCRLRARGTRCLRGGGTHARAVARTHPVAVHRGRRQPGIVPGRGRAARVLRDHDPDPRTRVRRALHAVAGQRRGSRIRGRRPGQLHPAVRRRRRRQPRGRARHPRHSLRREGRRHPGRLPGRVGCPHPQVVRRLVSQAGQAVAQARHGCVGRRPGRRRPRLGLQVVFVGRAAGGGHRPGRGRVLAGHGHRHRCGHARCHLHRSGRVTRSRSVALLVEGRDPDLIGCARRQVARFMGSTRDRFGLEIRRTARDTPRYAVARGQAARRGPLPGQLQRGARGRGRGRDVGHRVRRRRRGHHRNRHCGAG